MRQHDDQEHVMTLMYGKRPVRLPEGLNQPLWLVVVHGYGKRLQ